MNTLITALCALELITFAVIWIEQYYKFKDKLTAFMAAFCFVIATTLAMLLLMLFGWAVFNLIF